MNQEHVDQILQAVKVVSAMEVRNFYFVACGGSNALLMQGQYILDKESSIPSFSYTSNELILREPKALGKGSVVISCSHSGATPETVKATQLAREKGALTIAFSHKVGSPLWEAAELPIHYDWGVDSDAGESNSAMLYRLVFSILAAQNPQDKYNRAVASAEGLQAVLETNRAKFLDAAVSFGSTYKRAPVIYTMASGICYPIAYSFAICLLQEMLWVHSAAIHSGEYFHGPFEITDYDVPFIIIKGLGSTRAMDERAHDFCKKYSEKIILIDAQDFEMEGIDEEMSPYFANVVAGAVLRKYAEQLAEHKGHPLSVRRYMWKMEY